MPAQEIFGLLARDEIAHGGAARVHPVAHQVERATVWWAVRHDDQWLQTVKAAEPGSQLIFGIFTGRIERRGVRIPQARHVIAPDFHTLSVKIVEAEPRAERRDLIG